MNIRIPLCQRDFTTGIFDIAGAFIKQLKKISAYLKPLSAVYESVDGNNDYKTVTSSKNNENALPTRNVVLPPTPSVKVKRLKRGGSNSVVDFSKTAV